MPADPSTSITGWERIGHLFQVTFGFATGDITSAGVAIFNAQLVGMVLGGFAWGMLRQQVDQWQQQGFVRDEAIAELAWTTEVAQALDLIADKLAAAVREPPSHGGIEA